MSDWTPDSWALFLGSVGILVGIVSAGIVKIIGALRDVAVKVDKLEVKVDGRLTQLLERTASSSRAEGVDVGRGQMALPVSVPVPVQAPVTTIDPAHEQDDGTMVIGVPSNPTPPVLLVPVEDTRETEK